MFIKKFIALAQLFHVTIINTQIQEKEVSCIKIYLVLTENPTKYVKFSVSPGAPFLEKHIV